MISVDLSDERLEYAESFGADYIINGSKVNSEVKAVKILLKWEGV